MQRLARNKAFNHMIAKYAIYLAWLVAITATAGSLYFSEVLSFIPCKLCWFQRILMYPLVLILAVASYRHEQGIFAYVLPISLLGWGIAFYHYFIVEQKLLGEVESPFCQPLAPCDAKWIEWLGFITIPFLSLVAFTLITLLMISLWRSRKTEEVSS